MQRKDPNLSNNNKKNQFISSGGRSTAITISFALMVLALGFTSALLVVVPSVEPAHAQALSAWIPTTSYPVNITSSQCVTSGGYVYCVGGHLGFNSTNAVYFAPVSSSGVGAWTATTSLPANASVSACTLSGGFIYCIGSPTSYFAPVSSSGLGTWISTTSYPNGLPSFCATSGSFIYCLGGATGTYYAPISSSGVGAWTSTTGNQIGGAICAASGGFVYCVGGVVASGGLPHGSNTVQYAPLSASGVGAWTNTTSYPLGVAFHSCATSGGFIYCVGGLPFQGPILPESAVYFAPLSSLGVGAWTNTTNYPTPISSESCAASGGNIFCVGGGPGRGGQNPTNAVYFAPISTLSQTSQLTVNTQDTGGNTIVGYYTVLFQNGSVVNTGFSPAAFTLNDGQTYTLQVDDYGSCHFDHWLDTGSTDASRTISITSDTQITAVYSCAGSASSATVDSVDQSGNAIFGYYTVLYDSSANILATGFTTNTFQTTSGQTYSVQADSYGSCTFTKWSDGVTDNPRAFAGTSGALSFTAVYNCGTSTISVSTTDSVGAPITGYYTTLWQNGVQLQSCFSPCSFTVSNGQTYQVAVADYRGESFSHWSDNMGYLYPWGGLHPVTVPGGGTSTTTTFTAVYTP